MASSAGMRGCVAAGGGRRRRRQAVCAAACCVELLSCFLRRRLGFRGTGAAAPADAAQCTRQAGRRAWRQAAPRWVSERASHRRCQHTADDCAGARSTGSLNRGAAGVRGVRRDRGALTGRRCAGPMSSGGNRPVNSYKETEIIDGVTVDVKARVVTVKGKRGTLVRDFKHLNVEIYKKKNEKTGKDVIVVSFALCACWCPCLCCTCSRLSQQGAAGRGRRRGAAGVAAGWCFGDKAVEWVHRRAHGLGGGGCSSQREVGHHVVCEAGEAEAEERREDQVPSQHASCQHEAREGRTRAAAAAAAAAAI